MPYKIWSVNEILTAADMNTYVGNQTILSFAGTAARSSAIGTPVEGMLSYVGSGTVEVYAGTATGWTTISGGGGAAVGTSAPSTPAEGDLWWDSDDGNLYVYYDDGTSEQWVSAADPKVFISDTAPTGYDGQLWLDSTDGSMYVYYTDPGGVNSQWIGAVSRSGGILQVVSSTFTSTTTISAGSYTDTGLAVSITPRSTSSKIYIVADIAHSSTGTGRNKYFTLTRGTTELYVPDSPSSRVGAGYGQIAPQYGEAMLRVPLSFVDSPSTTSTVEYRVRARVSAASAGEAVLINRSTTDTDSNLFPRGVSVITAIEIAG